MKRHASAVWHGTGKEGTGSLTTQSGVFDNQPYSFRTRFESEDGKAGTNPEELIGAAHAACYAMALSFALNNAGFTADTLDVDAGVNLRKMEEGNGFEIDHIDLSLKAKVPGISQEKFAELAELAKNTCPVSMVLNAQINFNMELEG